ncbi:MAG: polymerase primary sigma factor [Candidatus Sumerlaeota bacterium]|nr:polymerase primary sigma factor [Candidatus Sumerlaeota bacterium]
MKKAQPGFEEDGIREYLSMVSRYAVLTREQEVALFRRYEAGDESAREEIVEHNLRFVAKIAFQYRGLGMSLADLIQEGNVGLLNVVDKFDWRKGFRFTTYAAFYIRQEMQAALHRHASLIRLPVRKARLLGKINEVCRAYHEREGRDPSIEEIAFALGAEVEKIRPVAAMRYSFLSADQERTEDGLSLHDSIPSDAPSPVAQIEEKQSCAAIRGILDFLSPRERAVVRLRYGLTRNGREYSLRQASKVVGISQEGVRRVEIRALNKLRRPAISNRVEHLLTA